MLALVVNCGSSSIKADILDPDTGVRSATLRAQRIGTPEARAELSSTKGDETLEIDGCDHGTALSRLLTPLLERIDATAVGVVAHRVVHGGERFIHPTEIDDEVEAAIESLASLAPLHNPINLAGIRAARQCLPRLPHVAVFDTAFHATLPARARHYALPTDVAERAGLRRYGFHGPSHEWVAGRAARYLGEDVRSLRLVTCHLGNGASVTAVEYGRSIETSMGMTPLEGLVMGTRSGDLDPGIILELLRSGTSIDALDVLLNRRSGLAGLSGTGSDMRDIEKRAGEGHEGCRLALNVFTHRLRKYIGAYAAVMGGLDAIVFTGGIGENSALVRHMAAQRLDYLGARLDEQVNRDARVDRDHPVAEISEPHARARLLVVATDEARSIASHAVHLVSLPSPETKRRIPIAVSARHIHLTQEMVEALFGKGHQLTPRKELSQPGQYACEETLTVVGPKRSIEGVRVLGPARSLNQVEISRTDEFFLGVDAPVRNSGDTANTPGVTLVGPAGSVTLRDGLICAARHIHMTPRDAEAFGVSDGDIVEVAIDSEGRDLVFGDVLVRVSPKYRLEMHIDTDEANAAEVRPRAEGMLVSTDGSARILRRRDVLD